MAYKLKKKNPDKILVYDGKKDFWNRRLYRDLYTGKSYVSVDGVPHTMTKEGEPLGRLKGKIIFMDNQ